MISKRAAAVVCAFILALVGAVGYAAPAAATGLIKCDVLPSGAEDNDGDVAIATVEADAIVYHNVSPDDVGEIDPRTGQAISWPHAHDFFGSRAVPMFGNDAVYNDVRANPFYTGSGPDATSCRIAEDTAGYWAPALICTKVSAHCDFIGQRIGVDQFSAYYRGFNGNTTHAGSQAIPADAKLVAFQSGSLGGGPGYGLSGWTCGQNSTVTGGQSTIPDCSASGGGPGDRLTAHVNFPSCWNGVDPGHLDTAESSTHPESEYGDTRDNDYGVGPTGDDTSNDFRYPSNKTACPASHPIEVTQLRETIAYDYTGDGTDVALVSDMHNGVVTQPRGSTMHVDFWNTWDQAAFVSFVQRCIQTAEEANCKP